jgi:hypothetical protein
MFMATVILLFTSTSLQVEPLLRKFGEFHLDFHV